MRIVDIPLKLIPQDDVANPDVELNDLHELTIHLLVLPEMVNLLPHAGHNLILKDSWQIMLLHQYFCEALMIQIWLIFIPQKHILQPLALKFQIEFDGYQL